MGGSIIRFGSLHDLFKWYAAQTDNLRYLEAGDLLNKDVTKKGMAAWADGVIPLADPFSDQYDVDELGLKYVRFGGQVTQDVAIAATGGQVIRIGQLGRGSRLFMKTKGLLNRNDYVRIGWSWKKGVGLIFRVAVGGKNAPGVLGRLPNWLRHVDFW